MSKNTKSIPSLRKFLYIGLFLFLLLLIAEIITSVFYYHQYGNRKLALAELFYTTKKKYQFEKGLVENREKNYRFQQLARPDSSPQVNRMVFDEMMQANKFVYAPWVEFRNIDYKGIYVNSNGFIRKSVPERIVRSNDTLTIWFFGGSTMYGFNVTDAETIPSAFASAYSKDTLQTKTLQVVNFGIPYYYSYQESQLFRQMLLYKPAPDIAIFLDGLNDFHNYNISFSRKNFFSNSFASLLLQEHSNSVKQETPFLTDLPPATHLSTGQYDSLINSFLTNLRQIERDAASFQCKIFFVLQPVPFYNYPGKAVDPVCSKNDYPIFNIVYPRLQKIYSDKENYLYLGDLLNSYTKLPFVDAVHYSPKFNEYIASIILQRSKL